MKIYVAGPMSGYRQFNYPAFERAAKLLRSAGHEVISPVELDSPELREACLNSLSGDFADLPGDETWGDMLARDVKIVADQADAVALLPQWINSRGARLEAFIAVNVQKPVFLLDMEEDGALLIPLPPHLVMHSVSNGSVNQGDVSRYENSNA